MIVKAKCNFAGALTMIEGEVKEYNNQVVLQDLIKAGFIEEVEPEDQVYKKTSSKGVKKNESK